METIREYPATDTEACVPARSQGQKRGPAEAVRLIRMADGSLQLATGNSRQQLTDSKKTTRSSSNLKSSNSIINLLKFKKSRSTATLSSSP